jgi:hypothetical protein
MTNERKPLKHVTPPEPWMRQQDVIYNGLIAIDDAIELLHQKIKELEALKGTPNDLA